MNISFSTKPFNIVPYFQLQDERWFYQHFSHLLQFWLSPSSSLGKALEAEKKTWQGRGARVTRRSFVQDVISVVPGQLVLHSCHFEADLKSPFIRHLPWGNVFDLQPKVLLTLGTLTNKDAEIWERNWNIWQLTDEHKNWGNRMAKNREATKHRIS